jgi:gluconate 5-dehydrogenase
MASLYAKDNITVNAIAPGLFETGITKLFFSNEDCLDLYCKKNPSGRYGNINELKGPIVFLSSDASSYVTGQFICVDGGYTSM